MKKTLGHLPRPLASRIRGIVPCVLEAMPDAEMVILFGSFARGDYVLFDRRVEFGIPTTFASDYDVLVLTPPRMGEPMATRLLDKAADRFLETPRSEDEWVQFLPMRVTRFNKNLSEARYNDDFVVTEEDIALAIPWVEEFRDLVDAACRRHLAELAERAAAEKRDAKEKRKRSTPPTK